MRVSWRMRAVNDQKIVSAGGRFGERDIHLVDVHAGSSFQVAQVR
jgi:hypothetical protein